MSLVLHDKGWKSFGAGRIWRCDGAHSWLVETDREGNAPSYMNLQPTVNKIRRIHSFYAGRVSMGAMDANGNGLDLLTANAMTESMGSVPSQLDLADLRRRYQNSSAITTGDRLHEIVNFIIQREKYLARKEPGYINPVQTPSRVSIGSHHMLISTALEIMGAPAGMSRELQIADMVLRLASESLFAAEMAVKYINRGRGRHQNEPPLVAASYNAGSPRPDSSNPWNLKQYGAHIDRWIAFYNTSRLVNHAAPAAVHETDPPVAAPAKNLELKVVRKSFTNQSTIGDLLIDEQFHCYTLEDVVRGQGVKVYGETAIPAGRYEVTMTMSNRFKKMMPLLHNVAGFEGVRIHSGNTAKDTLGCILVGANKSADRIGNCAGVYNKLVERINSVSPSGKVFITIG